MTTWCLTFINQILYVLSTSSVALRWDFGWGSPLAWNVRACVGWIAIYLSAHFLKCVSTQECRNPLRMFQKWNILHWKKNLQSHPSPVAQRLTKSTTQFIAIPTTRWYFLSRNSENSHGLNAVHRTVSLAGRRNSINTSVVWSAWAEINESVINKFIGKIFFVHFVSTLKQQQAITLLIVWN